MLRVYTWLAIRVYCGALSEDQESEWLGFFQGVSQESLTFVGYVPTFNLSGQEPLLNCNQKFSTDRTLFSAIT